MICVTGADADPFTGLPIIWLEGPKTCGGFCDLGGDGARRLSTLIEMAFFLGGRGALEIGGELSAVVAETPVVVDVGETRGGECRSELEPTDLGLLLSLPKLDLAFFE